MNYKVYVKDTDTSMKVLTYAREVLCYNWEVPSYSLIDFEQNPFLYFTNGIIGYMNMSDFCTFRYCSSIELTPEEFLKLTPEDVKSIPTHEEIMTKWWRVLNSYYKVDSYIVRSIQPYCIAGRYYSKLDFKYFISYDIPPEGNLE